MIVNADRIKKFFPSIEEISSVHMKEACFKIWIKTLEAIDESKIKSIHQYEPLSHLIEYPLVEHINEVANAVIDFINGSRVSQTDQVDFDITLAGAILHDFDKFLPSISYDDGRSTCGLAYKHALYGARFAREHGAPEPVCHLIESHSRGFSIIAPKTREALLLRHLDEFVVESKYFAAGFNIWEL